MKRKDDLSNGNSIIFILLILTAFLFVIWSCNKDYDLVTNVGEPKRFSVEEFQGENSGKTVYSKSSTTGKVDDGLFISQYPLVEYRYLENVTYDSIPTYTIDEQTQDTIDTKWSVEVVNRERVGFKKGVLWLPYDKIMTNSVYIGINQEYLDSDFTLHIEDSNSNFDLIVCLKDGECFGENSEAFDLSTQNSKITNEIPIFNESGEFVSVQSGIEISQLLLKMFQNERVGEELISFTLTITTSHGTSLSHTFDLKFVSEFEWERRNCWLRQEFECKDYYDE